VQSGPSSRAVRDGTRGDLARFTPRLSAARRLPRTARSGSRHRLRGMA